MADVKDQGLVSLHDGGWKVANGEPDVRGWRVVSANDETLGEVDDLIADPRAMRVRYLTVELDEDVAGSGSDRTVRVPIERARLHEEERTVVLDTDAASIRNTDLLDRSDLDRLERAADARADQEGR